MVSKLLEHGHDTVAASLKTGVDTTTGDGLAQNQWFRIRLPAPPSPSSSCRRSCSLPSRDDITSVADALIEPIAVEDMATAVGRAAAAEAINGSIEVEGPETFLIEAPDRRRADIDDRPHRVVVFSTGGLTPEESYCPRSRS